MHVAALIVHLIGLALGLGGATITDMLFVTAVRKRFVGLAVQSLMEIISHVVAVGYALLVLSGVALVLTGTDPTPRFWAKMVVVGVIGLNGWIAHRFIFRRLSNMMKSGKKNISLGFLQALSVGAAVSGVSWYSALLMGAWKLTSVSFLVWVSGYGAILLAAILASMLLTPKILRVDDPDFDEVFPVLACAARRSVAVWPEPRRNKLTP